MFERGAKDLDRENSVHVFSAQKPVALDASRPNLQAIQYALESPDHRDAVPSTGVLKRALGGAETGHIAPLGVGIHRSRGESGAQGRRAHLQKDVTTLLSLS